MLCVKKSVIILLSCILLAGSTMGICGSAVYSAYSQQTSALPTIVIDAGHGGVDAGVVGVKTGTKESQINLDISRMLKSYFVSAGFYCVMTRNTQGGLYDSSAKGFKKKDMLKRKAIIEECNPDIVISVHQNYCPLPSRRGGQVFYDKSSESGLLLATNIQRELNLLNADIKASSPLVGDYFMLKCTANPSVIVECGFLSNEKDEALLITETYQRQVAYAIFKATISFYGV